MEDDRPPANTPSDVELRQQIRQLHERLAFYEGFDALIQDNVTHARELFRPQGYGLGGTEDICANDPATGVPQATLEECMRTGVTAEQYGTVPANPANQYNTVFGGNPDLAPETADTYTFGIVFTPRALPGFTAAIDYYDIKITDTIGNLVADDII